MVKKNSIKKEKFFTKERFVSPIVMWVLIFSGIVIFVGSLSDQQIIPVGYISVWVFLICFIYWLFMTFNALYIHPKAPMSVASIKFVVKKGTYAKLRHPFYSGDIVLALGLFILFPTIGAIIALLWVIGVLIFWMKLEERFLEKKFGKSYRDYKKEVPMIIPRILQE